MKFSFLAKTTPHRVFNFKTRYYDADKEAFEKRVKESKSIASSEISEVDAMKMRVRQHYLNKKNKRKFTNSGQRNFRLIILIALLSGLTYWILM